ncbi:SDR family oxidoreductase [Cesiribacter sp. SM1]|uniref:SDR family oxidoreductase n=1 Tax=Cesiribacter sp. SM1 TaxID=2861196 RepID=UPI001CD42F0F|nr:SDR family oxidoreductase [Cesiribacter sp. SM1]
MTIVNILVIGATGTIGRHLLEELQKRNAGFRALVRSSEKALLLQKKGYNVAMGDLSDVDSLKRAMLGVEKVFLLSTPSEQQVELQRNAIDAAIQAGVKHIVKVSALGTYPDSPLQLGRMHAKTEEHIRNSGLSWTFLHPHTIMQNWLNYVNQVRTFGVLYSFTKDGRYAPIDARDVAAVSAKILTEEGHAGKTYVLTGSEAVSMKDVADALELALDRDIKLITVDPAQSYETLLHAGVPDWLAKDLSQLNLIYAQSMGSDITQDVESITGRKPITLKQFTQDHARVFL